MGRIWDLSKVPYLEEQQHLNFQVDPDCDDVIAVGGNLSPGLLLSAYRQGLFPWYNAGQNIFWWSPQQRFLLFPDELHLPKSLLKQMRRSLLLPGESWQNVAGGNVRLSLDQSFANVIGACAEIPRPGQFKSDGWISSEMQCAYMNLYVRGYAHSVECWQRQTDGSERLVGGLYGVSLGRCFYGESMFSYAPNASKMAFAALVLFLRDNGFQLIDCQQETEHLRRFGARLVPREKFGHLLQDAIAESYACWETYRKEFPDGPSLGKLLGR